jgi:MFS family permease
MKAGISTAMGHLLGFLDRGVAGANTSASRLWAAKLYYFMFFAAIGGIAPFFNIYLDNQGLSGAQIGLLGSLPPIAALLANPFWGAVADRWQVQRGVMALCTLGAGLLTLPFLWVTDFVPLLVLVAAMFFFRAPAPALLDSAVMGILHQNGGSYGRQRLFGSIGFVLFSYGLGQILGSDDLDAIFWIHSIFLGVGCTLLGLLLPLDRAAQPTSLLAGLHQMWRQPGYPAFMWMNILMGAGAACFVGFVGLHMLALGGTKADVGLLYALNSVTEIPVLFVGRQLLARFRPSHLITVGLVGFALVYGAMAQASSPQLILWMAPVLGVVYAGFWIAVVDYATESAPASMRATAQSLVGAAQGGLGWSIGALAGGLLWGYAGGAAVLWSASLLMLLAALVYAGPALLKARKQSEGGQLRYSS